MNRLAEELNEILKGSVVIETLSEMGKEFYFPKGIVAQAGEAKKHAKRYNATVGMAYSNGKPINLGVIRNYIPELEEEEIFSYAPTPGLPELRRLWASEMEEKNPSLKHKNHSQPLVVPGLTNGIVNAADLFVDSGDIVVIPDMFWGNYKLIFEVRRGARIVNYPFFNEKGRFNLEGFEASLRENSEKGKIITVLNFPNNPTGYSPSVEEAGRIIRILKEIASEGTNVVAITDDAYFGLFYEEETYRESLFSSLADLSDRILAIKVDGATKENLVWGFRIGFITFASKSLGTDQYDALVKKAMGAIRSSISNSSRLAQSLLIRAMKSESYKKQKDEAYHVLYERYRKVRSLLSTAEEELTRKKISPLPFNSGYFMTFKVEGGKAEELRKKLLLERGIGTISIGNDFLRVAYSSIDLENLEDLYGEIFEAAENL